MAKKKSHKKFTSTSENPFNIKVNRNKHSVLGQKVKGTKGKPGVSLSIGNARRREEFHKKKILSQKANKFMDKRLLNSSQTYEDPATARLIQERKKRLKKNIFNLNDEETLTHQGVPLGNDVSKKGIIESDDEEPLDSQFVKQAHFGGFSENPAKSRKEIIDEMIVESKKRKQERKLAKATNADLIEKLDQEWKEKHASTIPMLKASKIENSDKIDKNDPFDILLNELKFEKRTTPSSKLKTSEEIAKEEQEKQNVLERERNERMNPVANKEVDNYLSADSIYDGLDIQFEPVADNYENNVKTKKENVDDDDDSGESSSDMDDTECHDGMLVDESQADIMDDSASDIPDNLGSFINLVGNQHVYDVVEELLKGVIKNKTKKNVEKLENLFRILVDYIFKALIRPNKALKVLESILPQMYTLAEISTHQTANHLLSLLDKEQEYFQSCKGKKMKKNFPKFSTLVLFKIISKIYSVSDFRHPVVTPAMLFMCDILSSPFSCSYENTVSRLFICKIICDCVSYSKRYVPEVMFFLNKTLDLALENGKKFNLYFDTEIPILQKLVISFKMPSSFNDEMKASILTEVFTLLNEYSTLYQELDSYKEIFSPSLQLCSKLPSHYPVFLRKEISKFSNGYDSVKKTYKPLTFVNKKPVPLKLFEPNFESKFTAKMNDIKKKRKLVKSVAQKIKKEEKCLLREIRREGQVIASEKLREKIEGDKDRNRKVKLLYSELAMQEGEFKKYMKKK